MEPKPKANEIKRTFFSLSARLTLFLAPLVKVKFKPLSSIKNSPGIFTTSDTGIIKLIEAYERYCPKGGKVNLASVYDRLEDMDFDEDVKKRVLGDKYFEAKVHQNDKLKEKIAELENSKTEAELQVIDLKRYQELKPKLFKDGVLLPEHDKTLKKEYDLLTKKLKLDI